MSKVTTILATFKAVLSKKENISTYSDEELLEKHKSSNHAEYFGELYNRYIPLLYGLCLKYLEDKEEAHDAVMQLFENLLPKMAGYEITTFRTWLHTVAKNHCLQILRQKNREITVDLDAGIMESNEVLHLLSGEDVTDGQLDALHSCLNRLPDGQRICITHFFMNGMSYAEVAGRTGYSLKTVKSNIQNGKRNLKLCINKHLQ